MISIRKHNRKLISVNCAEDRLQIKQRQRMTDGWMPHKDSKKKKKSIFCLENIDMFECQQRQTKCSYAKPQKWFDLQIKKGHE